MWLTQLAQQPSECMHAKREATPALTTSGHGFMPILNRPNTAALDRRAKSLVGRTRQVMRRHVQVAFNM